MVHSGLKASVPTEQDEKMPVYQYSAGGDQECWHDQYSRLSFPRGQNAYGERWGLVADELASDFHSNHDGWEAEWPLQLRIYKDDVEVARFKVEREYEPTFVTWEEDVPAPALGTEPPSGAVNQARSALTGSAQG